MNWIAQDAPLIIEAAAKSQLGVFSLAITSLSSIAYYFFRNEPWKIKLPVFIFLFLGVSALGYSVIQNVPANNKMAKETNIPVPSPAEKETDDTVVEIDTMPTQDSQRTNEDKLKERWFSMYGKQWEGE